MPVENNLLPKLLNYLKNKEELNVAEKDITKYYGLVYYKARKFYEKLLAVGIAGKDKCIQFEDILQEGFVGLVKAFKKDNISTSYVNIRIEGCIKDFLRKVGSLSQEHWKKVKEYEKCKERLINENLREPTREEIAECLGISVRQVEEIEALLEKYYFTMDDIDSPIPSRDLRPDRKAEVRQMLELLEKCIESSLNEEERSILIMSIVHDYTLKELAKLLNKPLSTVAAIKKRAQNKAKVCLEKKGYNISDFGGSWNG